MLSNWLLGCDGAHSIVRHTLGVPFAGETLDSDWMLADVHMKGYPYPDTEASVYWHKDGAFVIFPISPGRYRVKADYAGNSAEPQAVLAIGSVSIGRIIRTIFAIIGSALVGFGLALALVLTTFFRRRRILERA